MSKRQRSVVAASITLPEVNLAASSTAVHPHPKRSRKPVEGTGEPVGVTFNLMDRAAIMTLSRDRRSATCTKGYRMLKTTVGVSSGAWFCEFTVSSDSKPGAHYRFVVVVVYIAPFSHSLLT